MLFRAPRHVVLLIRSPIMTDAVWCTPTCGINYSVSHHDGCCFVHPDTWYNLFVSPIKTDTVWCIPTRGITYSVLPSRRMPLGASRHVVSLIRSSHHDGCRLVHPDTWYHLNAIRHQDGCRLVHPAKWDIGKFRGAFVTDAD